MQILPAHVRQSKSLRRWLVIAVFSSLPLCCPSEAQHTSRPRKAHVTRMRVPATLPAATTVSPHTALVLNSPASTTEDPRPSSSASLPTVPMPAAAGPAHGAADRMDIDLDLEDRIDGAEPRPLVGHVGAAPLPSVGRVPATVPPVPSGTIEAVAGVGTATMPANRLATADTPLAALDGGTSGMIATAESDGSGVPLLVTCLRWTSALKYC